jgi:hypothetical protein
MENKWLDAIEATLVILDDMVSNDVELAKIKNKFKDLLGDTLKMDIKFYIKCDEQAIDLLRRTGSDPKAFLSLLKLWQEKDQVAFFEQRYEHAQKLIASFE